VLLYHPTISIVSFYLCDVKYQGHTLLEGNSASCLFTGHTPREYPRSPLSTQ